MIDSTLKQLIASCDEYQKHVIEYQEGAWTCARLNGADCVNALKFNISNLATNDSRILKDFLTWYASFEKRRDVMRKHGVKYD